MNNDRPFGQEVKALDALVKELYSEHEYLYKKVMLGEGNQEEIKSQIKILEHLIHTYERF